MIADKEGVDVPFVLNSAQARIDDRLSGRDIIPKARQEGVSSYYLARNLAKCLSKRNTRAVVISHETEATQRMLGKVHYMLEHIRGPKAVIQNSSKNEITFPKTNSMFYIGTAGSRKFGRGDTITDLHCSEVAFWDDPKALLAGLFQAVPASGEISIESTGNGVGNWYHRAVMQAASGDAMPGMKRAFRLHFLNWVDFEEYCNRLTESEAKAVLDTLSEEYEEPQLVRDWKVTAGQLAWRRDKLSELDWDLALFKQEYPLTLDECFQSSGRSIFHRINYIQTPEWKQVDANTYILEGHPKRGYHYLVGADVAGGIGGVSNFENTKRQNEGDRSVAEVWCIETGEQVCEFASNSISPDDFGLRLVAIGQHYNNAFIACEANNHGIVTLKVLKDNYPDALLYKTYRNSKSGDEAESLTEYGVRTSVRSRPLMLGELRQAAGDWLKIHSPHLRSEMSTFIEKENGKLEAETGCFDDRVLSSAVSVYAWNRAALAIPSAKKELPKNPDPFTLDAVLEELHQRDDGNGLPIATYTVEASHEGIDAFEVW